MSSLKLKKQDRVKVMSGSSTIPIATRIARAAAKYKILWGGHTQDNVRDTDQFVSPDAYERLLALSPYFRVCLDIGYFTAAGHDAVDFLQRHHERITDIHLRCEGGARCVGVFVHIDDVSLNVLNFVIVLAVGDARGNPGKELSESAGVVRFGFGQAFAGDFYVEILRSGEL
jgi:hypothetical protein